MLRGVLERATLEIGVPDLAKHYAEDKREPRHNRDSEELAHLTRIRRKSIV
jgi:hypothetical protein